jgi:His-Xaa-Ser system protein HxsD
MTIPVEAVEIDEKRTTAILRIDPRVYSKAAVMRTCYWLTGDLHCRLTEEGENLIVTVSLRLAAPTLDQPRVKGIDEWISDFFDSLIDSQLRIEIQAETAAIRELIIAKAFAESGVLEDPPPGTFADPLSGDAGTLVQIADQPTE